MVTRKDCHPDPETNRIGFGVWVAPVVMIESRCGSGFSPSPVVKERGILFPEPVYAALPLGTSRTGIGGSSASRSAEA